MSFEDRLRSLETLMREFWRDLLHFPWRNTALTLRERFREDRLGVTASSLTFTTLISLVPLFTVALAVFSAFPMFDRLQDTLQNWLVRSMVPENIARPVLEYLTQFASKAGQMGWTGALVFLVTALALILTIDRKLNDIWRVRRSRGLTQRVLVYWAVLTLGPLALALSLTFSTFLLGASRGMVDEVRGTTQALLQVLQFGVVTAGVAALYRYVPNTFVRWPHALLGGLFVATGFELGKKLLAWYLAEVPTYSVVYGTFATLPILLVWIYLAWVIVLLGAVVAAYLPSLLSGIARRGDTPGWNFQLALEVVGELRRSAAGEQRGLSLDELAQRLRVDPLQLEEATGTLVAMDWVGRLDEVDGRFVLLVDVVATPLAPLAERLLLARRSSTQAFWLASGWSVLTLAQALEQGAGPLAPAALSDAPQTGPTGSP
ncbi:MAG: YihY family inner membrane protein [Burkholderiales bacterium]|nr:MAG: YihY family inner membrane protein [Burkholderiales bacterium]